MSYLLRAFTYLVICLFIVFVYSLKTYASVVLNEVSIQPNQVVELYNSASESVDISSWYIDDAGGTTYFTVPSETVLAPKSCLLFGGNFNFNVSTADVIRLFDNTSPPTSSSAILMESYSYTKAPLTPLSFSKSIDGGTEWHVTTSSLGQSNESSLSCIPTPTPTPIPPPMDTPSPTETPAPTPTTTPTSPSPTEQPSPTAQQDYNNIFISEIFPYPDTNEHEWFELYNDNDSQVNLEHWYIDDGENSGSTPKSFSIVIDPYMYAVVNLTSSLFNNTGDIVRLLDSNKQEKDTMEYGKVRKGKSLGRISFSEDSFCEQEPSTNTVNSSCLSGMHSTSSQPTQKTVESGQKINPTIKIQTIQPIKTMAIGINPPITKTSQRVEEVLGVQIQDKSRPSPASHLSFVSFSYSLLTIVSVFIKMKNA